MPQFTILIFCKRKVLNWHRKCSFVQLPLIYIKGTRDSQSHPSKRSPTKQIKYWMHVRRSQIPETQDVGAFHIDCSGEIGTWQFANTGTYMYVGRLAIRSDQNYIVSCWPPYPKCVRESDKLWLVFKICKFQSKIKIPKSSQICRHFFSKNGFSNMYMYTSSC